MVTRNNIVLILYTSMQNEGLTHALTGANATMETTIEIDRFDALRVMEGEVH